MNWIQPNAIHPQRGGKIIEFCSNAIEIANAIAITVKITVIWRTISVGVNWIHTVSFFN